MRVFPKRSDGQDEAEMNIYESPMPLPDCDFRISFAARLRYNSRLHGAAGIPTGHASIAGIIEETIADEMPFTDMDTASVLAGLMTQAYARTSTARRRDTSPAPFAERMYRSARYAYPTAAAMEDGGSYL